LKLPNLLFLLLISVLLTINTNAEEEQYVQAFVKDPFIDMRTGPGSRYPIFFVAEQGEWIEILKSKTTWYQVRLKNGKTGWVDRVQLNKTLDVDKQPLGINTPDFDEFINRDWEIGVLYGDFEGADSISLYGNYHLTKNLSTEVSVTQALGNYSEIRLATINIINEPFPDLQPFNWVPGMDGIGFSPFFGIGTGVMETLPRATLVQVEDREDNLMFVTAGAKVYLTRRFLLQMEYRKLAILTDRNNNEKAEEWKIGFSIFF